MTHESIFEKVVAKALRAGADSIEVEYKDQHEWVFAIGGGIGFGIASFDSSSAEAKALRKELYALKKKKKRIAIDGAEYELRVQVYDSFGEDAFRIVPRRV
jgi:hypothetical protein